MRLNAKVLAARLATSLHWEQVDVDRWIATAFGHQLEVQRAWSQRDPFRWSSVDGRKIGASRTLAHAKTAAAHAEVRFIVNEINELGAGDE